MGQARLDTVKIYDDRLHWDDADLRVVSDNTLRPYTLTTTFSNGTTETTSSEIYFTRKWYGHSTDSYNGSCKEQHDQGFLNTDDPDNFRGWCHELGHCMFSFWDEYLNKDGEDFSDAGDKCPSVFNYGFMDNQYDLLGVYSSEMSLDPSAIQTWLARTRFNIGSIICRVGISSTMSSVNITTGCRRIFKRPDERNNLPSDHLPEPNDNLDDLDYNVGVLVQFPPTESQGSPTHAEVLYKVLDDQNQLIPSAEVRLKPTTGGDISQGMTVESKESDYADLYGRIYVLGLSAGDQVTSEGRIAEPSRRGSKLGGGAKTWLCGVADYGKVGTSAVGNRFFSPISGDTGVIAMKRIEGYYPVLCGLDLFKGQAYSLRTIKRFGVLPQIDLTTEAGTTHSYTFSESGEYYYAQIGDSLEHAGTFTVWASDDVNSPYFFSTPYTRNLA